MESRPRLQPCVVACKQCGIRFLTDPRNANRTNLRCPFGCREHSRKQRSNERSTAYYQTPSGKKKKERLNARRYRRPAPADGQEQPAVGPQPTSPHEPRTDEGEAKAELRLDGVVLDESSVVNSRMLPYVRMVVSLIERIRLSCRELVRLLRQVLRQHTLAFRRRTDYVLRFLHQHPP